MLRKLKRRKKKKKVLHILWRKEKKHSDLLQHTYIHKDWGCSENRL